TCAQPRSGQPRPLLPNDHLPPLPPTHLDPSPGAPGAPWCPPRLADAPPPGSRTKGPEARVPAPGVAGESPGRAAGTCGRSEEHTSELQSRFDLVCRLLLEKKKRPADGTRGGCGSGYGAA